MPVRNVKLISRKTHGPVRCLHDVNKVWNPDGCLSLREWELSLPILAVAPDVVADDEWAVPLGLPMYRRLPTVQYHHTHQSLASAKPVWPIAVMGQEGWPTQPELGPPLHVAA